MSEQLNIKYDISAGQGSVSSGPGLVNIVPNSGTMTVKAHLDQDSLDEIRKIVREEVAALKKELVADMLNLLETKIRVRAGTISINEVRTMRGLPEL